MSTIYVHGGASIYQPTGLKTASGWDYGQGIAIAEVLLYYAPLKSHVYIRNLNNAKTLDTFVADTGNFGIGRKYPVINTPSYELVFRIADLPLNIAKELGVEGSADVEIALYGKE